MVPGDWRISSVAEELLEGFPARQVFISADFPAGTYFTIVPGRITYIGDFLFRIDPEAQSIVLKPTRAMTPLPHRRSPTFPASKPVSGLDAAMRNYSPLIIGANTQLTDGSGPFAPPCPDSGSVQQTNGTVTVYESASPGSPALCRMRIGGTQVDAWYGIWLTTWPGADQAAIAMHDLIHGRTGNMEAFDVRLSLQFSFHDVLRNDGVESIRLLGRTDQALKLSHNCEGTDGNTYRSVTTGWKDLATGMLLYVTYQHIAGVPVIGVPLSSRSDRPSAPTQPSQRQLIWQ